MRTSESFRIQERDIAVMCGLLESRVMTLAHVADIYFDSRREAAKKRLQTLKWAGLVTERVRLVNEPSILSISRAGVSVLSERGLLADYSALGLSTLAHRSRVSGSTLHHELEVTDVKAAVHAAVRDQPTLSIAELTTWPTLYEFRTTKGVTVKPDGFIRLHERKDADTVREHAFFLEVDRSTETQTTLVNRAICYLEYYKSGGFAVRSGAARAAFKGFPFRVLMVFCSAERRNNMAERLLHLDPPILSQVWLSILNDVTADPFSAIWIRPLDYRDATAGTVHDVTRRQPRMEYRRQTSRDIFVDNMVKKQQLLEASVLPLSSHETTRPDGLPNH